MSVQLDDKPAEPHQYTIRTLRDIYELPTDDMMERCMKELTSDMLVLRRTTDLLNAIAKAKAEEDSKSVEEVTVAWPEECVWTDDNGGTSVLSIQVEGKEVLQISVTHKKRRSHKRNEP